MLFKNYMTLLMFCTQFVMFNCGVEDTFDNSHINSHGDNHVASYSDDHKDSFGGDYSLKGFNGDEHHYEDQHEEHHQAEEKEEEKEEETHEEEPQRIHTVHHYHIQKYTVIKKVEVPVFKEVKVPYKVYVFQKVPYKFYVKPYIVKVPIEYYHTKEEKHEKPTHEMVKHDDDEHGSEDYHKHHMSAEKRSFHSK